MKARLRKKLRRRIVMVPRRYTMTQLLAGALHQQEAGSRTLAPGTLLPQLSAWHARGTLEVPNVPG